MGLAYRTASNNTFALMQINDVAGAFDIAWHKTYTYTGARSNIQASYRPYRPVWGSTPANSEGHFIYVQRASAASTVYHYDNAGTIQRAMSVSSTLSSSVPCYGATSGDSQAYLPCQIVPSTESNPAKIFAFYISLSGTTSWSTPSNKAISFELLSAHELVAGELLFFNYTSASQTTLNFYG